MTPLKLAVLGAGHLGRIHARLLSRIEGVQLVGVVDPIARNRQQVAEEFNTRAFASHAELIGQIDAAVVAAPTPLHHALTVDLLDAGIHCLVEKPITTTVSQAEDLIARAEANGLVLSVGHVERFNPALSAAVEHIGRPKYIEAVRTSTYTCRSVDVGVVLDLMIHDLDAVLQLVGSPLLDVQALGVPVFGPHEDMAQTRLTFQCGCVANVTASRTSFRPQRQMHVYWREGYAGIDFTSRSAKVIHLPEPIRRGRIDVASLPDAEQQRIKNNLFSDVLPLVELVPEDRNALLDEQQDFIESIRTGAVPKVTGRHGRDALAAAERILSSIATHPWDGAVDLTGPQLASEIQRRKAG